MGLDIDIQEKLDSIEERTEESLNQTPSERNADEVSGYYQELLQARTVKDHAPEDLKAAEERYYKAKYGDQYLDVLQQKYTAESRYVLEKMMKAHQAQLKTIDDKIKTYTATATYLKNMEEVKKMWLFKTKVWVDKINQSNASLNNRNTFYADEEQSSLSGWILFENCILLTFVLVTIVMTIMGDKNELKMKVIGSIVLLCILFFTNTFLTWLRYLPKSITFYTQWGYDPMESKIPWLLLVFVVLFGTVCVVYITVITEFLENMTDRWNGRPPRHTDTRHGVDPRYPRFGRTDPRYARAYDTRYRSPYDTRYARRGTPYDPRYGTTPYDPRYGTTPYDTRYARSGTSYPRDRSYRDPRWRPSPDELRRTRELLGRY